MYNKIYLENNLNSSTYKEVYINGKNSKDQHRRKAGKGLLQLHQLRFRPQTRRQRQDAALPELQ